MTLFNCLNDESKIDERSKHNIKLIISGRHAPETFKSTEQAFYLIAFFVQFMVIIPRANPAWIRGNDRIIAETFNKSLCFVALIGPVHYDVAKVLRFSPVREQFSPGWSVTGVAGG